MGPYAWQFKPTAPSPLVLPVEAPEPTFKDTYLEYPDLANLPRARDVFRNIEMDSRLKLQLPRTGCTAGRVLQHCVHTFESLVAKHKPLTFKFGITHDASVRWHNSTFGYKFSKDPFDEMIILYAAGNPHGPSFLEAMLIDRFGGFLFAH